MKNISTLRATLMLFAVPFVNSVQAGQWLPPSGINQIEARDGSWFSVVMNNTADTCPSNRVIFRNGTWTNQDGVNHHYSLMLAATASKKEVSIHVEIENNECIGRISYVKG